MIVKKDPMDEQRKAKFAEHIRIADAFAREGNYETALLQIQHALNLDPKNYYARSMQERLRLALKKTINEDAEVIEAQGKSEEDRLRLIDDMLKKADRFAQIEEYDLAFKELAKIYALDPENRQARAYSDYLERLVVERSNRPSHAIAPGVPGMTPPPSQIPVTHTAAPAPYVQASPYPAPAPPQAPPPAPVEMPPPAQPQQQAGRPKSYLRLYREMLKEMWFDGKLTAEESTILARVRTMFGVTMEEHTSLEREVHGEAYIEALRAAWREGALSESNRKALESMRDKYGISLHEHMSVEAEILWAQSKPKERGTILVVDDNQTMLLALAAHLKRRGYQVLIAPNVEQALMMVRAQKPALIVSDMLFGGGEWTGIEFFDVVRSNPGTKDVPFFLMSGRVDKYIARACVRLGVDWFLPKPFEMETLVAMIEGRLGT